MVLISTFLVEQVYQVSKKKHRVLNPSVKYLGFELSQGQRDLPSNGREALARAAAPTKR